MSTTAFPAAHHVAIGNLTLGNDHPLALIAGPCALESRAHAREMCQALVEMTAKLGMGLIYKTSFDKANRTSLEGERGLGMKLAKSCGESDPQNKGYPVGPSPYWIRDVAHSQFDDALALM